MSTISEVAEHLNLSERSISTLISKGVIERRPRGQFSLDAARLGYIAHLRETAAGRTSGAGSAELIVELTKLRAAQAAGQEFKNAIQTGEFVRIDVVGAAVDSEYAMVRERLLTLPGKLADALAGRDRAAIETELRREVNEALTELSDPARMAEAVTAPVVASPPPKASPPRARKARPVSRKGKARK